MWVLSGLISGVQTGYSLSLSLSVPFSIPIFLYVYIERKTYTYIYIYIGIYTYGVHCWLLSKAKCSTSSERFTVGF